MFLARCPTGRLRTQETGENKKLPKAIWAKSSEAFYPLLCEVAKFLHFLALITTKEPLP